MVELIDRVGFRGEERKKEGKEIKRKKRKKECIYFLEEIVLSSDA